MRVQKLFLTPNSGPDEVEHELQHGKENPLEFVHADGKSTKNDKSYYFDVTGHVIANVDNMTNINRPRT
jgi:hypothetical protein